MNRRWLVLAVLAALLAPVVLAADSPLTAEEAWAELVGTWVNSTYDGWFEAQKTVVRPGYVGEDWKFIKDGSRDAEWKVNFKKAWVDAQGDTYCQCFFRYSEKYSWTSLVLFRVNRAGKVLEILSRKGLEDGEYPTLIDTKARSDMGDWYTVYYRQ